MRKDPARDRGPDPAYLSLLGPLDARLAELAAQVATDVVREGEPDAAELEAAHDAVTWLLASLRRGPVPDTVALRRLREGAAAAGRAGAPVRPVLDRALSAGWVTWAAVVGPRSGAPPDGAALAALGEALLRTGDAAAAAIADAHAAAERERATRSASALRELLDELLELPEGDEPARAHLARRLAELGVAADTGVTVVLVDAGRDLEDGDPAVDAVARALARGGAPTVGDPRALAGPVPAPVVAASHGRLVLLLPAGRRPADPADGLRALAPGWTAVQARAPGVLAVAAGLREASAALVVASRLMRRDTVTDAASLLLERALLAEPELLAAAVDRELGPLERAPRGGSLLPTVEAYLAERENVRAAGRRLGVAPRTVAYRLARVTELLGGPLDDERRLRLATALYARRLLAAPPATPAVRRGRAATRAAAAARPR